MRKNALLAMRKFQNKNATHMAKVIGTAPSTYTRKENSVSRFNDREIALIANDLGLTVEETAYIFLDAELPNGKFCVHLSDFSITESAVNENGT